MGMPELDYVSRRAGAKLAAMATEIKNRDRIEYREAFEKAKVEQPDLWKSYSRSLVGEPLKEPEQAKRYGKVPDELKRSMQELQAAGPDVIMAKAGEVIEARARATKRYSADAIREVLKHDRALAQAYTSGDIRDDDWELAATLSGYSPDVLTAIREKYFG